MGIVLLSLSLIFLTPALRRSTSQNHNLFVKDGSCIQFGSFGLCNKSLGLQHYHAGHQQCISGGKQIRGFNFTWNRLPTLSNEHSSGITASGVIAVHLHNINHERLRDFIRAFKRPWSSWKKYVLTKTNSNIAVLFIIASFPQKQDYESLAWLRKTTKMKPIALGRDQRVGWKNQFRLFDSQGRTHDYYAYKSEADGRLILVTFDLYPTWSHSELKEKSPVQGFDQSYIYGTNWYAFGLMKLPIMDFFDTWYKIDTDIRFLKPFPSLTGLLRDESRNSSTYDIAAMSQRRALDGWKMFMHTGFALDPSWAVEDIVTWRDHACAIEDECCNHRIKFTCQCATLCNNPTMIFFSNFVGGALGFWQSPEVMNLASSYETFPNGMWKHRWTDQQWFNSVLGLFVSDEEYAPMVNNYARLRSQSFKHELFSIPRGQSTTFENYFTDAM